MKSENTPEKYDVFGDDVRIGAVPYARMRMILTSNSRNETENEISRTDFAYR